MRRITPILLILLLAFALRLINITERTLWYDEAFAVLFSEKGLDAMLYGTLEPVAGGASDIHPLLYYSTLNLWMGIAGESPLAVRLWSVLLGLATIYVVYRMGCELFSEEAGLAAALVTAAAPFHVQYSQEVRMYSLMALLLMLVTWCFIRAWRTRKWGWWIAFGIFAGLAMYTQQLSAFYLMAIGLIPFLTRKREQIQGVIVGTGAAVIIYLPWLLQIPSQLEKVNSYYWIDRPTIGSLLLTLRSFFTVNADIPAPASMIALLGALFLLLFLLIQVWMYVRKPRRRSESDAPNLYFVLWLFMGPILLMWGVSQVQPVYLERALLPSSLMLYIALGWLFTRSGTPRLILILLGVVGIGTSGIGLYYHYTWATFPNSPFDDAVATIRENSDRGTVVVHMNKLTALPMVYYDRDLTQRYLADAPGRPEDTLAVPTQESLKLLADECIQAASQDAAEVWFVVFDRAERQYEAAGRTELSDARDWLDEHFTLMDTLAFNDLNLYHYADPSGDFATECE